MKLKIYIWLIQVSMAFTFLFISFIPLIYFFLTDFSLLHLINIQIYYLLLGLLLLIGLTTFIGIVTLKPLLRRFSSGFFSFGVIVGLSNVYLLSLGVIISWIFYEIWDIGLRYSKLDEEYEPYEFDTMERELLKKLFVNQVMSLSILSWITLSLTWGLLLLATNVYIQLGKGHFGTLGLSLSISILLLFYLMSRFIIKSNLIR